MTTAHFKPMRERPNVKEAARLRERSERRGRVAQTHAVVVY